MGCRGQQPRPPDGSGFALPCEEDGEGCYEMPLTEFMTSEVACFLEEFNITVLLQTVLSCRQHANEINGTFF